MIAKRYRIRLYHWAAPQGKQIEVNLDPSIDSVLRAQLEAMVKARKGTLNLDLAHWKIVVRTMAGHKIARCEVTTTGGTAVKRW